MKAAYPRGAAASMASCACAGGLAHVGFGAGVQAGVDGRGAGMEQVETNLQGDDAGDGGIELRHAIRAAG